MYQAHRSIALVLTLGLVACTDDADGTDDGAGSDDPIRVVFQSKWFAQAQFAGYYIAGGVPADAAGEPDADLSGKLPVDDDGMTFYEAEGLEVTIIPGVLGDTFYNPSQEVAEGRADFGTDWIANMIRNVEDSDYELRHVAQIYQRSGFEMVAPMAAGINSIEDFGMPSADGDPVKVGIWVGGNEFPVLACLKQFGLLTDIETAGTAQEGQENVTTVSYGFDPALVFPAVEDPTVTVCEHGGGSECSELVDVASAMVYNELNQIVGLGYGLDQLQRFNTTDAGCGLLEDFVFTTAELLDEEDFKGSGVSGREVAERFVRATVRGWQYAADNEADAVGIVLDYCGDTCAGSGSQASNELHQAWQMSQVNSLVAPAAGNEIGCLDLNEFDATVDRLTAINFVREGTGREVVDTDVAAAAGLQCQ